MDYLEKFKVDLKKKLPKQIRFNDRICKKEEQDPQWVKYSKYKDVIKPNRIMDEMRGTSLKDLNGIDLGLNLRKQKKKKSVVMSGKFI